LKESLISPPGDIVDDVFLVCGWSNFVSEAAKADKGTMFMCEIKGILWAKTDF
jgi:hypothetical protein